MPKRLAIKNHANEQALFQRRIWLLVAFVALLVAGLMARLFYLQVNEHRFYTTLSQQNLLAVLPVKPKRGLIYDRNGVLLADNVPTYTLAVIPNQTKNLTDTLNALKSVVSLSQSTIDHFKASRAHYRPFEPIPLKYRLSEDEVNKFYVNQYEFPGVIIQTDLTRQYPLGSLMSNVLGYVGRINTNELKPLLNQGYNNSSYIGKVGIEKQYETLLRGTVGADEVEIDASGKQIRDIKLTPPQSGQALYLTIDSQLQKVAVEALGHENGAVVVIQPSTGEVLALATNPSYDPNGFVNGMSDTDYQALLNAEDKPLYNRAIRGLFAPGSTVKPFIALYSLDHHVIDAHYTINDPGTFQLPHTDHIYNDWRPGGHGLVNVTKAIIVSCDTFFYNLANKLGQVRLDASLQQFGFGSPTGIDMPEELSGLVPTPDWKRAYKGLPWYAGDTILTGIGQGYLLTTPLQLAEATSILAMHGEHLQPHLVNAMRNEAGVATPIQPIVLPTVNIGNTQNWKTVVNAMQAVVNSPMGTGIAELFGPPPDYTVAAKTGTAQVRGKSRSDDTAETDIPKKFRNNHLFIAFAPVKNPQIAIAVLVEHNTKAPSVARKVMDYYFHKTNHHESTQTQ